MIARARQPRGLPEGPTVIEVPRLTTDTPAGANQRTTPLTLLAQYLKDLSFENPGAPGVLTSRGDFPRGQLNLDVKAKLVAPMQYEVSLLLGITATRETETIYIVE